MSIKLKGMLVVFYLSILLWAVIIFAGYSLFSEMDVGHDVSNASSTTTR